MEFQQSLPEISRPSVQNMVDDFRAMGPDSRRTNLSRISAIAGDGLVVPAGAEDNESETESNLQSGLCSIIDERRANDLEALLRQREDWYGKRRLGELRDRTVSHEWLWSLNPCHGPVVPPTQYLIAVRLRLGAPSIDVPMMCPGCGLEKLDRACQHALSCALPEATRGHNNIRDVVLQLANLADPTAATEF